MEWYSHSTIAPFRSEEIPLNPKTYGTLTTEIVFKKNKSVFKDWKENTDKILKACAEHDFECWKIPNMPKFRDDDELKRVKDIIAKNIEILKIIHIYYASENNFPYAGALSIQAFLSAFKITDANTTKEFKGMIETNIKSAFRI